MIKQMGVLYMMLVCTLAPNSVLANEALARNKACLACHQVEKKVVGPAFKDVATKYKGQKNASAMLTSKIKSGGKGVWGPVPMPPQNVSTEEARQLATWVLGL